MNDATFEIWPAIDLKGGRCVRLLQGDLGAETVYNNDPSAQAAEFAVAGFDRLHIVDLDGAVAGDSRNGAAVEGIVKAFSGPKQLGGGVRDMASIERWLTVGVDRVILGTAAVRDPDLVAAAARAHPGRIVVGVDAKDGEVRVDGWLEGARVAPLEVAKRFEDAGVAAIVYTDIARDGALGGPNTDATAALAEAVAIPIIASGGVSGAADIEALAARPERIAGVIAGRALYDGRLTAGDALAAAASARQGR
ncbi:MAG: 1-(5-phosphoribosyl)-5-[(5-phosphoribosylamino)methylideneamino]imidazole-4-carboxamide isomerase [Pseudomonadota bacterium]